MANSSQRIRGGRKKKSRKKMGRMGQKERVPMGWVERMAKRKAQKQKQRGLSSRTMA